MRIRCKVYFAGALQLLAAPIAKPQTTTPHGGMGPTKKDPYPGGGSLSTPANFYFFLNRLR
jgi:hypothetical protein